MKKLFTSSLVLLAAAGMLQVACSSTPDPGETKAASVGYSQEQILRGEYLVNVSGCHDCHSPKVFGPNGPEPDPERLLSGHPADMPLEEVDVTKVGQWVLFNGHLTAAVGPWGASFSANLTSDPTGVGNWTEEQFFTAIRKGKYKGIEGGRNLMPPMPWPQVAKMTDEDLRAVFAYLKTVKPIKNVPPAPIPMEALTN
ncbi:cytochrome c [Cesiribacter sp. SM1]|uniref:c-type cytochrome n=1 Tax=Cesiribacter sp. SM1 TaxID=2861196 RepID=UPI001CD49FB4|nr:cytochrome c [Cesiribacter sp. SM1]